MGPMIKAAAPVLRAPLAAVVDILGIVTVVATVTFVIAGAWDALAWLFASDSYGGFRVTLWALAVVLVAITVRDWLLAPVIRWFDAVEAGRNTASIANQEKRRNLGYPE